MEHGLLELFYRQCQRESFVVITLISFNRVIDALILHVLLLVVIVEEIDILGIEAHALDDVPEGQTVVGHGAGAASAGQRHEV